MKTQIYLRNQYLTDDSLTSKYFWYFPGSIDLMNLKKKSKDPLIIFNPSELS